MPWQPFNRFVEARVGPSQTELVNAEMWDPDTGAVLVVWPVADASETGIMGPDVRRTEIASGDWWEAGSRPDGATGLFQEYDYYTEVPANPAPGAGTTPGTPGVVFHRASMGATRTLCDRDTRSLQPMTEEWDPVLEPLVCDHGCSPIESDIESNTGAS